MNLINDDIIFEIFKFLPVSGILIMGEINKRFLKISRNRIWPIVFMSKNCEFTNKILSNYTFESYEFYHDIQDLSIIKNNFKSKGYVTAQDHKIIKGFHKFKFFDTINIPNCDIPKSCFKYLTECKNVNIFNCESITDSEIIYLKNCHKINLDFCNNITDKGFKELKNCYSLKLTCTKITDDAVKELNCDYLDLSYCKITNDGIKNLKCKKLILSGCIVTDDVIKNFIGDNLDMSRCNYVTDEGIESIKCTKLVIGAGSNLTFTNINKLQCVKLDVSFTSINDEHLKTFKDFKSLNITGCHYITDNGLIYLRNCEKLIMMHCPQITDLGIEILNCKKIIICERMEFSCINKRITICKCSLNICSLIEC